MTLRMMNLSMTQQLWAGTSFVCNLLITLSMFYYLWKAKQWSATRRMNNVLGRLIHLTVETGFICTASSITSLILFTASQRTSMYTIPLFLISKLYSNCLLAVSVVHTRHGNSSSCVIQVLNSRVRIMGGRDNGDLILMDDLSAPDMTLSRSKTQNISLGARNQIERSVGIVVEISQASDRSRSLEREPAKQDV